MDDLIELIKDSDIKVLNVLNWGSKKDRYTSGSLPNMISHIEGVIGVSHGKVMLSAYKESLSSYKGSDDYIINTTDTGEYYMYLPKTKSKDYWYSRSMERLMEIQFERQIKRELKGIER